jgi:hypothetical protein
MARARGANAVMAAVFETSCGTTPAGGFRRLRFVSANLGEEQSLIQSDLLGYGRDPLTIANRGDFGVYILLESDLAPDLGMRPC